MQSKDINYNGFINQFEGRENIEWANFWYDEADHSFNKRMLMIGDSTSRIIRRQLSIIMDCPTDLFASSAALRDILFWNQLDCFFNNSIYNKYDYIIIWLGNHSRINEKGDGPFEEYDYKRLENDFKNLLSYINKDNCKLLVMPSLYIFKIWQPKYPKERFIRRLFKIKQREELNEEETLIVKRKNKIMEMVSKEMGIPFFDIASYMLNSKFKHIDHIHYENAANNTICSIIKQQLDNIK